MTRFWMLLVMFASALHGPAAAQESDLVTLETRAESQGWEAVGRLDIAGAGFCTGALIRDRLVLTAAHCIYDANGDLIDPDKIVFQAGLRNGQAQAVRTIRSTLAHPNYVHSDATANPGSVAVDIAVLELDQPIRNSRMIPYRIAQNPIAGDSVGVVSYGRGRSEAPSLQEVCRVLGRQTGVVIMTCDVEFGSSGSPVFTLVNGQTRIASVVSAMAEINGQKVSLGTSLDGPLNALLSHFATMGPARPGGTQRLMNVGEVNDTGAKFVRP